MTINIHPGEILLEEFMKPMEISGYKLAKALDVPGSRIDRITKCERDITPDTALRLDRYFGLSEGFFTNLQAEYDIRKTRQEIRQQLKNITPYAQSDNHATA